MLSSETLLLKEQGLVPLPPERSEDNRIIQEYAGQLREKYLTNRKILLVQTPQFQFESFNVAVIRRRGYYAYPPTGLQRLAAALQDKQLSIHFLDLNYLLLKRLIEDVFFDYHNWLSLLDEYLEKCQPAIVAVTCISVYNDMFRLAHPFTALLDHLRRRGKYLVIVGGPAPSNEYQEYLQHEFCHFVLTGEGENKIRFLIDVLYGHPPRSPPSGIYFKFKGRIEKTAGTQEQVELQGNLIETYRHLPVEDYNTIGCLNPYSRLSGPDKPFGVFQLHRGCRANCKFCGVSKYLGRGARNYPVPEVVDEIKYLIQERGVRHLEALDDDFLGNPHATKELLQEMVLLRQNYGITWSANNGLIATALTEEILQLLRDSGCLGFKIGVESGDAELLKKIRKPASLRSLRKAGVLLQSFPEMFIAGYYILGILGEETFEQMCTTLRFSSELNLDWASFSTFQFTSKETLLAENLKSTGREAHALIPSRDSSTGEIKENERLFSGPAVFDLSPETIPSPEQVQQIWFTFNFVANYLNNKNLKPGGRPDKFASWLEAVYICYPQNLYMPLFIALAHSLLGNRANAERYLQEAKANAVASEYWKHRCTQLELFHLLEHFPQRPEEVYAALEQLRAPYIQWLV